MREPPSVTDSALAILSHFTQSASTPLDQWQPALIHLAIGIR